MDIFSSDKAPYAFVLMISVLGWFLTNAVSEGRKHLLLTYSSEVVTSGDEPYLRLVLRNDSVELPLVGVTVDLSCQDGSACLSNSRTGTGKSIAVAQMVPPWSIDLHPEVDDADADQPIYSFSPSIPAGASLTLIAGLVDAKVKPAVLLHVPGNVALAPDLAEGFSFYGFLFRNYFSILLIGGALSTLVFVIWIALIATAARHSRAARPTASMEAMG